MQFFSGETSGVGGNVTTIETASLQSPLFHNIEAITPDRIAHAAHHPDILVQAHPESHILSGPITLQQTNDAAEIIIPTRLQSVTQDREQPTTRSFSDEKIAERLQAKGVSVQEDQIVSPDGRILTQLIPQENGANFVIRVNADITNDQDLATPTILQQKLSQAFDIYQIYVATCFDAVGQEMPQEEIRITPFLPESNPIIPSRETTSSPTDTQNTDDMQEPGHPPVPSSNLPSDEYHPPNPQAPSPASPHYAQIIGDMPSDLGGLWNQLGESAAIKSNHSKSDLGRALAAEFAQMDLDDFGNLLKRSAPQDKLVESLRSSGIIIEKVPPGETFETIRGQDGPLRKFRSFARRLTHRHEFQRKFATEIPKGLLVYGPPGTGKTELARAMITNVKEQLANRQAEEETKDVVFMYVRASQVLNAYVGETPKLIDAIFDLARQESHNRGNAPVVMIIDEADQVLGELNHNATEADKQARAVFKSQIEGLLNDPDTPISVVAITNYPTKIEGGLSSRLTPVPVDIPDANTYPLMMQDKIARKEAKMDEGRHLVDPALSESDYEEIARALNSTSLSGRDIQQLIELLADERERRALDDDVDTPFTKGEIIKFFEEGIETQTLIATREAELEKYRKEEPLTQSPSIHGSVAFRPTGPKTTI